MVWSLFLLLLVLSAGVGVFGSSGGIFIGGSCNPCLYRQRYDSDWYFVIGNRICTSTLGLKRWILHCDSLLGFTALNSGGCTPDVPEEQCTRQWEPLRMPNVDHDV